MRRTVQVCLLLAGFVLVHTGCDNASDSSTTEPQLVSEVVRQSFAFGDTSRVTVQDFVGKITIQPGSSDSIHVVATKYAEATQGLGSIQLMMTQQAVGLLVVAENPLNLSNASVDIEITAPPEARFDANTGVGDVIFAGRPRGSNASSTGVGSLVFTMPADVNLAFDLRLGVGQFVVEFNYNPEQASGNYLKGTIGSGDEGSIRAQTGVGDIRLLRQ